ncbi:MAG: hypothetical protein QMC11_07555 [Rhodospirillales bacterium]
MFDIKTSCPNQGFDPNTTVLSISILAPCGMGMSGNRVIWFLDGAFWPFAWGWLVDDIRGVALSHADKPKSKPRRIIWPVFFNFESILNIIEINFSNLIVINL